MGTDKRDSRAKKKLPDSILNILCVLLTVLILFGLIIRMTGDFTADPYVFGYRVGLVVSDSMEPAIPIYSLVVEKEVLKEDMLACGDIVSYYHELSDGKKMRITHRIVEMSDGWIYTKGDHNSSFDTRPLTKIMVESRVILILPHFIDVLATLICMMCCVMVYKSYKRTKINQPNAH